MDDARVTRAWLLGLAVVVFWGLSFVATRVAVAEIPPLTLAFARFAIALVLLWPWVRRGMRADASPRDRRGFLVAGLLGITVAFVLENVALQHTTAGHASVIVAITPIATALTEAVVRRRRPAPRVLLGLVVALGGVGLVVGRDASAGGSLLGDGLLLLSVAAWVAYAFLAHDLAKRHSVAVVTAMAVWWGTVTLAPLAAIEVALGGCAMPSATALAAVLGLGVFCSALAYLWWNHALDVLGVTATNSLVYGIPLVAVAGGVWWLGEPLTATLLLGGGLVIVGLYVANAPGAAPLLEGAHGDEDGRHE